MAIYATEIQQEGLRIPLMKLNEAGRPNASLLALIESNTRQPVEVLGDLRADCRLHHRRKGLAALVERYGAGFPIYVEALHDHAEAMMRETIRELPNGVYVGEDFLDGLGENPVPIRIRATVTIADDTIDIDFSGTSDQVAASINCPISPPESAAFTAIRCLIAQGYPELRRLSRRSPCARRRVALLNPVLPRGLRRARRRRLPRLRHDYAGAG